MSEWFQTELKNLTVKIGSGATPRGGQEAYKTEGISLIRSQNILDFSFSTNGLAYIDDEQARQLQNVEIQEKDVLINITGDSVARVCMVPAETLPARVNQHVAILRADSKKLDPDYLLYYLLNPVLKRHLLRLSSDGATRNALTKSNLEELIISAPKDIIKQREIAEKIKLLDSKISLLRQQNQTLEELALTLFKRWFVEFEFPDENGQPYKSTGGKMIDSELGEIPKGWRVGEIIDFGKVVCGKTPSKQNPAYYGKDVPFLKIPDMHNTVFPFITVDNLSYEGSKSQINKLIPAKSIIVSCIATVGLVCINPFDCHTNQQINSIVPKDTNSRYYLFHALKEMKYILESIGSGGSATLNVNTSVFSQIEIVIPSQEIFIKHFQSVNPVFEKMLANQKEIQTLTQLRDTLLPKLMNGEKQINDE